MQATVSKSGRLAKIKTVIMLDDDELLLQSFRLLFRQCLRSYTFHGFTRAEDALIFLRNERCDVVLLDLSMPGTAWETINRLRKVTKAPILLHSGWDNLENYARDVGADGFIAKPCSKIEDEINRLCG